MSQIHRNISIYYRRTSKPEETAHLTDGEILKRIKRRVPHNSGSNLFNLRRAKWMNEGMYINPSGHLDLLNWIIYYLEDVEVRAVLPGTFYRHEISGNTRFLAEDVKNKEKIWIELLNAGDPAREWDYIIHIDIFP